MLLQSKENPCKTLLGGIENIEDIEVMKPTDFSNTQTRKARHESLYQQYEDEISRLMKINDSLTKEVDKFQETSNNVLEYTSSQCSTSSLPPHQYDTIQLLKKKLEQTQATLDEITKSRDTQLDVLLYLFIKQLSKKKKLN
jgi:predicted RNase H-like nuclease (RuvC/YqgF family)